jgi:predicted nucleic acid-binding protein
MIVPPQEAHFDAGYSLYASRPDKDWSLTDCISFVLMKELGVSEALTGDHHFQQAGFVALLA